MYLMSEKSLLSEVPRYADVFLKNLGTLEPSWNLGTEFGNMMKKVRLTSRKEHIKTACFHIRQVRQVCLAIVTAVTSF